MTTIISKSDGRKQWFEMPAKTIRCYEKICDFYGDKVTVLIPLQLVACVLPRRKS